MFEWLTGLWETRSPNISYPYNVSARDSTGGTPDFFLENTKAFNNRLPDALEREKLDAAGMGVVPAKAGTHAFRQIMDVQRVAFKWVVTVYGDLYIVPIEDRLRNAPIDPKHSVAANGEKVFTAGSGGPVRKIATGETVIAIDNTSGHYHPTEVSVQQAGLHAWAKAGYPAEIYDKNLHQNI